ncbi:MAG: hypothetical protein HC801_12845 [Nitrospira sp.]|nr:hypothetical protein [Nitrospira sp.]
MRISSSRAPGLPPSRHRQPPTPILADRGWLPKGVVGWTLTLDHPRMLAQLLALDRRTSRGGRDSIDHPPRGHDDLINSAAGAVLLAAPRRIDAYARKGPPTRNQDIAALID